jgi:hypothetical protein
MGKENTQEKIKNKNLIDLEERKKINIVLILFFLNSFSILDPFWSGNIIS